MTDKTEKAMKVLAGAIQACATGGAPTIAQDLREVKQLILQQAAEYALLKKLIREVFDGAPTQELKELVEDGPTI